MKKTIDLGFAEAMLPPGTHICHLYEDKDERDNSLLKFLAKGFELKERLACFTNDLSLDYIINHLKKNDVEIDSSLFEETMTFALSNDTYYNNDKFEPERMLQLILEFYNSIEEKGCTGGRIIGEMTPDISYIEGGERLLEYESRVNLLLRDHPITTVCQYHVHDFDGATIMDVLKVHPMMYVRGAIVHNPFYIPPEEVLSKH